MRWLLNGVWRLVAMGQKAAGKWSFASSGKAIPIYGSFSVVPVGPMVPLGLSGQSCCVLKEDYARDGSMTRTAVCLVGCPEVASQLFSSEWTLSAGGLKLIGVFPAQQVVSVVKVPPAPLFDQELGE